MNQRERVLIILCLVAAIGAGIFYLIDSHQTTGSGVDKIAQKESQLRSFVTKTTEQLTKEESQERELYIIKKAGESWNKDPFLQKKLVFQTAEKKVVKKEVKKVVIEPPPKINATYTGYINLANHPFAIIDGREYQVGEKLRDTNFFVSKISPSRVLLVEDYQKKEDQPVRKPHMITLSIRNND